MYHGLNNLRKSPVFLGGSLPSVQVGPRHEGLPRYFSLFTPGLRCAWHSIIGASLVAITVNSQPGRSAPSHPQPESEDLNVIVSFNPSSYDVVIQLDNGVSFGDVKLLMPSAKLVSSGARKYALLKSFGNAVSARNYGLSLVGKVPWPLDLLIQAAPARIPSNPSSYINPYQTLQSAAYLRPRANQAAKVEGSVTNQNINPSPGKSSNVGLRSSSNSPVLSNYKPLNIAKPSSDLASNRTKISLQLTQEPVESEVAVAQVATAVVTPASTGSALADASSTGQQQADVDPVVAVQQQVTLEQEIVASSESAGVAIAKAQEVADSTPESTKTSVALTQKPVASEVAVAQVATAVVTPASTGSALADASSTGQQQADVDPVVAVQQQVTLEQEIVASSESSGVSLEANQKPVNPVVEERTANKIELPLVSEKSAPISFFDSNKNTRKQSVNTIAMEDASGQPDASSDLISDANSASSSSLQPLPIANESGSTDRPSSIPLGSEKLSASSSAALKSPFLSQFSHLIYLIVEVRDPAEVQQVQNLDANTYVAPLRHNSSPAVRETFVQAGVFNDSRIGRQLLNYRVRQLTGAGFHVRQLRGHELLSMKISIDPSMPMIKHS